MRAHSAHTHAHRYPNSIPAMMWIVIIVTLAIQDYPDAGVILFLHAFNSSLGFYETLKAGDALSIEGESSIRLGNGKAAEVLVFDLP